MDRKHTFNIGYVIVAILIIEMFQVWFAYRDTVQLSYSDVIRLTEEGKVAAVTTLTPDDFAPLRRDAVLVPAA